MSANWVDYEKQSSAETSSSAMSDRRRMSGSSDMRSEMQTPIKCDSGQGNPIGPQSKEQVMSVQTDWARFERSWKQLHNEDEDLCASAHDKRSKGPNQPLTFADKRETYLHEPVPATGVEERHNSIDAHDEDHSSSRRDEEASHQQHGGENKAAACTIDSAELPMCESAHEQQQPSNEKEKNAEAHRDHASHASHDHASHASHDHASHASHDHASHASHDHASHASHENEATMPTSQHRDGESKPISSTMSSNHESDYIFCPTPAMHTQQSLAESSSVSNWNNDSSYRSEHSQNRKAEHAQPSHSQHAVHQADSQGQDVRGIHRYAVDDCMMEQQQGLSEVDLRGLQVMKCVLDKLYRASCRPGIQRMRKFFLWV
jgi:hypothetical protein